MLSDFFFLLFRELGQFCQLFYLLLGLLVDVAELALQFFDFFQHLLRVVHELDVPLDLVLHFDDAIAAHMLRYQKVLVDELVNQLIGLTVRHVFVLLGGLGALSHGIEVDSELPTEPLFLFFAYFCYLVVF